jgi:hypothetical protein
MSKISKRVSKYLIARQQRASRLEAFGQAMDAGILESQPLSEAEHSGVVWNLTAETAALFSGDVDRDRELIHSLLETTSKNRKRIEQQLEYGEFDAFNLDEEDGADQTAGASAKSDGKAPGNSATLPETGGAGEPSANLTSKANESLAGDDTTINWSSQKTATLRDHVLLRAAVQN